MSENRIVDKIEAVKFAILDGLASGSVTQEKVDALHKTLDMSFEEHLRFQELKSVYYMMGRLNLEEAMSVYHFLGESVDHFNKQPIEVKTVLTQVFTEMLGMEIKSRISAEKKSEADKQFKSALQQNGGVE